ncbi:Hypothetical protein R9X50_00576500 [Acrodontium crateriforme]|uniref:Uncharacterized protein n=1 Tax=Acrodontium crateriforme TaxID=150365 RepID=A0AAQ3MCV8_9PEZI|nr:Hypothetical protein R9X50_00576500 [Acrodontium crateriforme]
MLPAGRTALRASRLAIPPLRSNGCRWLSTSSKLYTSHSLPKYRAAIQSRTPDPKTIDAPRRFREFELDGRVFIVTGAAGGLGLALAEALVEAGGYVYCLDRAIEPPATFFETQDQLAHHYKGSLQYRRVDVSDAKALDSLIGGIAAEHNRMDGLVAAAGIQYICKALEYPPDKITEMMNINYKGVYLSAVSCARQMIKYDTAGSIVLIGSMSGLIANKQLFSSVYNSSKAAVIQLGRSLAMEWKEIVHGRPIRVNVLCPGNTMTPMVRKNIEDEPHLKQLWERENMLGRLAEPHEFRGATLFMLSDASSFMTGAHLVIDGGYTAW